MAAKLVTIFGKKGLLSFRDIWRINATFMELKSLIGTGIVALLVGMACGQDGKARYEMLCGACHGVDGKGAGEGAFPPLAGSDWVQGDPERMIQVILHGLEGPVTVKGKTYNLAMPPQGAALTDEHIAEIATYVRSAWGNNESKVGLKKVQAARKRTASREEMWKAPELLKRWPLAEEVGPIEHLVASFYKGDFKEMPDFSKLDADAVEEEASGFIELSQVKAKGSFAMVWEGAFQVEADRDYTFRIDSDDGSRLYINDVLVTEVKGLGPMGRPREGRVLLKQGKAKIRVEYFEARGQKGIAVAMIRPGKEPPLYFTREKTQPGVTYDPIPIVAKDEARIYRNFIKGTSARAIGVGYPGGVNLAFSADDFSISQAWVGDFIDGGLHWTGRGQGSQEPGGQRVVRLGDGPAIAILGGGERGGEAAWPTAWQQSLGAHFTGYFLDAQRRPEFRYQAGGVQISDKPEAVGGGELVRNFSLVAGENPPTNLALRLSGPGAKALGSHLFEVGKGIYLEVAKSEVAEPVLINGQVVLKLKLKAGENRVGARYVWK